MLTLLHVLIAVLASFRLVDMLLGDRIAEPIRKRFGRYYLFSCPKCLSVWAGGAATAALVLFPWLNWPLALSWLYIAVQEARGHYYAPKVQYVPYTPKKDVGQRLQDSIGELAVQNMLIEQANAELRQQLSNATN